ncbi:hypothetical protein AB0O07_33975 [Streptomyces sp. NPDC093085]|uniref:BACON domain-containing protein n=1 Tax=Streptomyces sp. NPDC093085 TaxID=3155068 RepID=UPI0034279F83
MSSSPATSTRTTGAHRALRRAPRSVAQRPPARYEPYLDGLFTYCLSVLCDHDAATEVLGDVLAISERQYGRCPSGADERKAWLYALARWACLRKLTERRRTRQGAHSGPRRLSPAGARAGAVAPPGEAETGASGDAGDAGGTGDAGEAAAPEAAPPETAPPGWAAASGGDRAGAGAACGGPGAGGVPGTGGVSHSGAGGVSAGTAERRRRELALLAWPEAAGTTPEQREVLELAVRHRLGPRDVAAVLSKELTATKELLSSAACEVERTRAALAVVDTGDCPSVARLTGDHRVLLSAALRRELVRHVDDCPRCRRAAERAQAAGPWPGSRTTPALAFPPASGPASTSASGPAPASGPARASAPVSGPAPASGPASAGARPGAAHPDPARPDPAEALPLVEAERGAVYAAMLQAPRARTAAPRFGRNGFPLDPKDHAARRDRLRARAVTTTVVATVVAAPVLALWAAYRGAPQTGEGHDGSSVSALETTGPAGDDYPYDGPYDGPYNPHDPRDPHDPYDHYENANSARDRPGARYTEGSRAPDVAVELVADGTEQRVPGALTVEARNVGDTTLITLRATGGERVSWTAATRAPWLTLSRHYGTLDPGESLTVRVSVDHAREPAGPWSARVALYPAGQAVRIQGYGARPAPPTGHPNRPGHPTRPGHPGGPGAGRPTWTPPPQGPGPSDPGPSDPGTPEPTDGTGPSDPGPGAPSPTPPDPDPPDPGPTDSTPPPAPTGGPGTP